MSAYQKEDISIPKKIDVNVLENKIVNIPSVCVSIPLSQTNKPNYKSSKMYHFQDIVRKK